ncbi:MAG: maleylpyruvate isomerase family mycothiol-dependent enzyme [Candidatus Tectomicrobia bacterium]|nr:maleylpyruvate isomerase family mycothiol-dependent enzyme [Candidatus Tectomicrobia bacterium]
MKDLSILMEPIPFISEEAARQAFVCRKWTPEEWEEPTFCKGWTRKHVVAHLKLGADFYEKVVSGALKGVARPPYGAADKQEFIQRREAEMKRLLALAPDVLVDEFEVEYHSFLRIMKSLGLEDLRAPAWHPMGAIPAGHFAGMRLFELALHDWDIRAVRDPGAALRDNLLTPLLRAFPFMQVRFLNLRPAAKPPEGTFRFRPDEAAPWSIAVRRGLAERAEEKDPEAEVAGEGGAFILHTTGRLDWREAERRGRLSIAGDRRKTEQFLDAVSVSY